MKLTELLLLEYDRDITSKKFGDKLELASQSDTKVDVDKVLSSLEDMDPTKNKQYVQWLVKQYIKKLFRLEDSNRVKQVLVDFDKLKPRLPERDINRFTFHELEAQIDKVLNPELGDVNPEEGASFIPKDAEVLYAGPLGQLTSPKTEEAACELGKGTKWCTASDKNNRFQSYHKDGPLYIWRDRNGSKYQFHFETSQFMDAKDKQISDDVLHQFRNEHPVLKKLFKQGEAKFVANGTADTILFYAEHVIKQEFKAGETKMAEDPDTALEYADWVLRGRFPEGEAAISAVPDKSYYYANNILHDRFPKGEASISTDAELSKRYINFLQDIEKFDAVEDFKSKFKFY